MSELVDAFRRLFLARNLKKELAYLFLRVLHTRRDLSPVVVGIGSSPRVNVAMRRVAGILHRFNQTTLQVYVFFLAVLVDEGEARVSESHEGLLEFLDAPEKFAKAVLRELD